jgi:hypothetical protein
MSSSQIKYHYVPAQDTLAQTKTVIVNMENTVAEAMTNCAQFFGSMDANSKAAMQDKFNAVLKTGDAVLAACKQVNITTSYAVDAMQITDNGLAPSFG